MINKSGLTLRLAIVVIFAALAVGLIVSQIFFRITYVNEFRDSQVKIEQLYKTVSSTASIASYLEDAELIDEVIAGLISNDIIDSVAISTDKINAASSNHSLINDSQTFALFSPFEQERQVGELVMTPNIDFIEQRAKQISRDNQVAITIQATIVTIAVIIVSYIVVTKPIISVAKKLHKITPGTDIRIEQPTYHNKSELGLLVSDINGLLERGSKQIIQERELRQQVEKLSKHFKLLFENSNSPIVLSEPNGNIILYNKAFTLLLDRLNVSLQQSFGPYLRTLFDDAKKLDNLVDEAFGNSELASGEFKLKQSGSNSETVWVQTIVNSAIAEDYHEYYQITLHDISLRRQQVEQLNMKAYTDKLTNLLNRRGAEQHINSLIHRHTPFALLMLDLNRFKPINDIYGHDAGDEMLNHVAQQLTKSLRKDDILSRWGGDEFVVVLPNVGVSEAKEVCEKIKVNIEKSHFLITEQERVAVGASIGVTFYPDEKNDLVSLIKAADEAMYSLKGQENRTQSIAFYRNLS